MSFDIHYCNEKKWIDLEKLESWHCEENKKIDKEYKEYEKKLNQHWSGYGRSGSGMSIKAFEDLKREKQNEFDRVKKEAGSRKDDIFLEYRKCINDNTLRLENERLKADLHKLNSEGQAQRALQPTIEIPVTMPGKVGKVTSKPPKKRTQKQTIKTKIEAIILKHLKKNRQASYDVMHGEIIKAKNGGKFPAKHTCENWISKIRGEMNPPKPIR